MTHIVSKMQNISEKSKAFKAIFFSEIFQGVFTAYKV